MDAAISLDDRTDAERRDAQAQVEALLEEARRRFRDAEDAERDLRARQREDLDFLDLEQQWPEAVKQERLADRRPCLSVDRIMPFVRQVLNQIRAMRPRLGVAPRDDGADPETAAIFQDLIRYIEDRSRATLAYQTAAFHQVALGRGFLRVVTEYADEHSFDQELRIVRVRNPFSVYLDPYATDSDARDARYAFVVGTISREAFEARFGRDKLDRLTQLAPRDGSWIGERGVQIAEYWYLDSEEDELWKLEPDPSLPPDWVARIPPHFRRPILRSALPHDETGQVRLPPGMIRTAWRKTTRTRVRWAIISGTDLLVGDESGTRGELWPTRALHRIPIVPVLGEELDFGDRLDLRGLVRPSRDIQKLYNFHVSALAEEIALKPKAPYIGYEGQFATHEKKWQQANRRSYPYLEVRPITIEGTLAPLPRRDTAEPAVNAIVLGLRQADYDLKSVMGLYEPSLGDRRGGQSGRAILALQRQGEIGVGHFPDNLAHAMRAIGEILVDLIPAIYGDDRVMRLIGERPQSRVVRLRAGAGSSPEAGIYDLGSGRYDVIVTVGPSQETRRQEVAAQLAQFINAYPAAFPVLGDLLMSSLDWDGAQEAARRLKALLPPQVAMATSTKDLPPQAVAQIAALQQQIQALSQQLDERTAHRETLASQERIAALKAQVDLLKQEAKLAARQTSATEDALARAEAMATPPPEPPPGP